MYFGPRQRALRIVQPFEDMGDVQHGRSGGAVRFVPSAISFEVRRWGEHGLCGAVLGYQVLGSGVVYVCGYGWESSHCSA